MKRAGSFCCVLLLSAGIASAEDSVPKPLAFARYQGMMDKSPFAVATAAAPPPTTASFAKDLYVANAAKSPDGDMVTIGSSADKNFKKYLTAKTPVDGYSISNIEWSDKVGATKVTISKDGQFATLTFNQALISQPIAGGQGAQPQAQPQPPGGAPPVPPPPGGVVPGGPLQPAPPAAPGAIKPAPIPMLPTPPPRVRGVIPRSPNQPNMTAATPQPVPTPEL
ncbi:MAG: hypothetical protein ACJ8KU_09155 [Chthoniobacterales bacterium]